MRAPPTKSAGCSKILYAAPTCLQAFLPLLTENKEDPRVVNIGCDDAPNFNNMVQELKIKTKYARLYLRYKR